jgi:predicted flap endonuclease-1-like 5' DNA nuclease
MQLNLWEVLVGLVLAAGIGSAIAWALRSQALARSATYVRSLEQLLAGTLRDRDAALERERVRLSGAQALQHEQVQRLVELEKELEHRELQVITFREEAIQLARTREELGQRLARREQTVRELESALAARSRDLEELEAFRDGARLPGARGTGPERELAALLAAHESDLAQLEARFLDESRARESELESLRLRLGALEAAARELGERDAQLAIARERIAELEPLAERAVVARSQALELEQELRDAEAARSKLQKRLAELEPRLRELEQRLTGSVPSRSPAESSPTRGSNTQEGKAAASSAETDPGQTDPLPPRAPDTAESAEATPRVRSRRSRRIEQDDLKLIHGIDSAIERALNELGVTSFRQIAKWKEKDIERIARKLEEAPERIHKDGWVEGARREHIGKYGRGP